MKNQEKIKLTLIGKNLSITEEITKSQLVQIMAICSSGNSSHTLDQGTINQVNKDSIVEYYDYYSPKRNPDKILVLAGYIKEVEKRDSFSSIDVKKLFRDVGEVLPANFIRDFKWSIKNGWIAPDSSKKGNYFITKTGIKVLINNFSEELISKTKGRGNIRK